VGGQIPLQVKGGFDEIEQPKSTMSDADLEEVEEQYLDP